MYRFNRLLQGGREKRKTISEAEVRQENRRNASHTSKRWQEYDRGLPQSDCPLE